MVSAMSACCWVDAACTVPTCAYGLEQVCSTQVSRTEYVLIDFEHSGRAGNVPAFEPLSHWAPECKPNAPYQPAADIYSVGALISEEDLAFELDDASTFRNCLMAVDPTQRPSASEALKHPWLSSTS